ncbi:MAG: ABC transporter substrate-binding protein [Deltaproteobacteria bacterium]|nr:ABC transporter substrate-binding protein [Deltaproteobacteria bacterium]
MRGRTRPLQAGWSPLVLWTLSIALLGALMVGALAVAGPAEAQARKDEVTLRASWLFAGYDVPYFVARHKGYYEEAGLAVQLQEGRGSVLTMQLIANKSNTFGIVDGAVLAIGVERGMPVRMVAGVMQRSPAAILVLEASGIRSPKEMAGKIAGLVPGSNTTLLFPVFLEQNGVRPDAVTVINVDPPSKERLFRQGRYQLTSGLLNYEVPALELAGEKVRAFLYADHGVNTVSLGLIAHADTIRERPDLVRRFVTASMRGWAYARANPEEAVESVLASLSGKGRELSLRQLKMTFDLLQTEATRGKPLGWMAREDWEKTQGLLLKAGAMKQAQPVERFYTNEFVPPGP